MSGAYVGFPKPRQRVIEAYESMQLDKAERIENLEINKAERTRRLQHLFLQPGWTDILSIMQTIYDTTLEGVMEKKCDPDALRVFDDFIKAVGADVVKGYSAMTKLADKRLKANIPESLTLAEQLELTELRKDKK